MCFARKKQLYVCWKSIHEIRIYSKITLVTFPSSVLIIAYNKKKNILETASREKTEKCEKKTSSSIIRDSFPSIVSILSIISFWNDNRAEAHYFSCKLSLRNLASLSSREKKKKIVYEKWKFWLKWMYNSEYEKLWIYFVALTNKNSFNSIMKLDWSKHVFDRWWWFVHVYSCFFILNVSYVPLAHSCEFKN